MPQEQSREELLQAINSEIEDAQRDAERSGWTTWALVGGFASLFWLGTDVLKERLNPPVIAHMLLVALFLYEGLWPTFSRLGSGSKTNAETRLVSSSVIAGSARSQAIFRVQDLFILAIVCFTWSQTNGLGIAAVAVIYSLKFISFIALLVWMSFELPLPLRPSGGFKISTDIAQWFIVSVYLVAALPHITWLWNKGKAGIPDVRLAGIAFGFYLLAEFVARQTQESPLLADLRELRRAIVFDQLSVEAARSRADAIISGFGANEMIQAGISRLVSDYSRYRFQLQEIRQDTEQLSREISGEIMNEGGEDSHHENALVARVQAVRKRARALDSSLDRTQRNRKKLVRQASVVATFVPESAAPIQRALQELTQIESIFQLEVAESMSSLTGVEAAATRGRSGQLDFGKPFSAGPTSRIEPVRDGVDDRNCTDD